jgi:nucleotide-binding universal stress UspA family protein
VSYATVLAYIDAAVRAEEVARVAAGLADKFHATLIGLSALEVRPLLLTDGATDGAFIERLLEAEMKERREKLAAMEIWFRAVADADWRKTAWRSALDFPTEALAREARCADLIVIRRTRSSSDPYTALDPGLAILKAGRAVLTVPDGVSTLRAEHVVVGWKDTREARRALHDALPFLHEATRVTIAEICRSGEEDAVHEGLDDIARYLARHRIKSGPQVILHSRGSEADALIRLAQEEGADLLVTGAYGHSRLGEWIFGGMTRDLLAKGPICCVMSH